MAHFAQIDENNIVLQVLVVHNDYETDGANFLAQELKLGGEWIQTSYNHSIRKNFAGIGFYYDRQRDAFIPPKPFDSWILDEETCRWEAPIPYPNEGRWDWNEELGNWVDAKTL